MGFTTQDTLALILVVNVTAALGAFLFGYAQDRFGHIATLVATLIGWMLAVVLAFLAEGLALFWVAANVVGLCLGSSQSAARGLVGYLAPPDRTAEFFGLWGLAVKLSAVLGPITYGAVTWISGGNHRLAILLTGTYFAVGLVIVIAVDVVRGRAAALAAAQSRL
jgi:UMF1 family MFS transporter